MATYRGQDGAVTLGGQLQGSPLVDGAVAQGLATFDIDAVSLTGVVLPNDTFTVAGDVQVYTVVSGGIVATNALTGITFTPTVVPGGGWSDNAAVTFVHPLMAEVVDWSLDIDRDELETSVKRDAGKTYDVGQIDWRADAAVRFDYDDAEQAQAVDQLLAGTPTNFGLSLIVEDGKLFTASAWAGRIRVQSSLGGIVSGLITFLPAESGQSLAVDWN